jgi:hypothetical protein
LQYWLQIGRNFAVWAIVFGVGRSFFLKNITLVFYFKIWLFIPLGKNPYLVRLHFGSYLDKIRRFFTKRLVTLGAEVRQFC